MSLNEGTQLIEGEDSKIVVKNVGYVCPYTGVSWSGSLTLTNYRLIFKSWEKDVAFILEIPNGTIAKIDRPSAQSLQTPQNLKNEKSVSVDIYCKDVRNVRFTLNQETQARKQFLERINQLAFPLSHNLPLFAFENRERFDADGWSVYDAETEMRRLGVPNDSWRLSDLNRSPRPYEFSETYPLVFAVPKSVPDDELKRVAQFRSRARIPVLSWIHPETQTSITRSSQPQVGVSGRRSNHDEKYIQSILDQNAQSHKLFIADARPNINAVANKAKGGGYEQDTCYPNCELHFMDIGSIHVMRQSLMKLKDCCFPNVDEVKWLTHLESTKWLDHIRLILAGACKIAERVEVFKTSVLVHCSDGWDRTAQLTSLALLMLDPYYRTITGFEVLVEKEWCSFGHKFAQRIGHGEDRHSDSEQSPVFVQFIDAVWQMTKQFPSSFEFADSFLLTILEHLTSCRFGNFLFNCERERAENNVKTATPCLWSLINSKMDRYRNPFYTPSAAVILPVASVRRLKFWTGYFMQHNPKFQPQEPLYNRRAELLAIQRQLERRIDEMHRHIDGQTNPGLLRNASVEAVV